MLTERNNATNGSNKKAKTILRAPGLLKPLIVREICRRGGRVRISLGRNAGPDRDLYVIVARALGVTDEERKLCVGDTYDDITDSGRADPEKDSKRNVWDYNMLVAVEHMKLRERGTPCIKRGSPKGVWELTEEGNEYGRRLLSEDVN